MAEASVVLLHALAATPDLWAAQRTALVAAGYPVLAPWLPGPATVKGEPSLEALADQVARQLDHHGMHRIILVGCSMGGYLAGAFLRRHPGRAEALVLLSTKACADDDNAAAKRREFARRFLDPELRPAMVRGTVPKLVGATTRATRPKVLDRVTRMVDAVPVENVAWAQRAIADRVGAEDVLGGFTGPVSVLAGAEDELIDSAEAEQIGVLNPAAIVRVVPGAGHLLPVETPDVVTEAVFDVLARTTVAAQGTR